MSSSPVDSGSSRLAPAQPSDAEGAGGGGGGGASASASPTATDGVNFHHGPGDDGGLHHTAVHIGNMGANGELTSIELQPHVTAGHGSGHTFAAGGMAGVVSHSRRASRNASAAASPDGSHAMHIAPSDKSNASSTGPSRNAQRRKERAERAEKKAAASSAHATNAPPNNPMAGAEIVHVLMFNSPKETLMAVTKSGMAKAMLPWFSLFILAFNAGVMLSMSNLAGFVIGGGFGGPFAISGNVADAAGPHAVTLSMKPQGIWAKFIHGAIFPIGLVLIVLAGSELVTGNVMYLSAAVLSGKAPKLPALGRLGLAWLGNFIGSVVIAFLLAYLPKIMHDDPQRSYLASVAHKKLHDGWGSMVLKGIGCNWLVCMALWCNLTAQDIISKIVAIWMPIAAFFWIGWEHVVANFFTLPLALMEDVTGSDGFGEVLAWNIIPVSIGNLIGGSLFAFVQWFIYGEHRMTAPVAVSAVQQAKLIEHLKPTGGSRMRRAARHNKDFQIQLHPSDIADSANPHRATGRALIPIERRAVENVAENFQSGDTSQSESEQSRSSAPANPVLHTARHT